MKIKKAAKLVIIVAVILALLMGGGFGYLYFNGMSGVSHPTEAAQGQIRVACVGDSTTYGHGISNWPKNNYPVRLRELLGDSYHVNSYGVSGRAVQPDSDQPYTALTHYQDSLAYDADILVFMMGVNDSKPENWHGPEAFRDALVALLDSYGDVRLILCTPTAAFYTEGQKEGLTNYDIQPQVAGQIAQIVREVAAERDCLLLDIHALTLQHPEWFAKDGVHPDNSGAAAIAQTVAQAIREE